MTTGDAPTPTPRVMLANLAHLAVAQTPGLALTAGENERWVTADRHRRIPGITAVADDAGRFELGIHVVAGWPCGPLGQLTEDLRARVRAAARRAMLDAELGAVQITVESVQDPRLDPTA